MVRGNTERFRLVSPDNAPSGALKSSPGKPSGKPVTGGAGGGTVTAIASGAATAGLAAKPSAILELQDEALAFKRDYAKKPGLEDDPVADARYNDFCIWSGMLPPADVELTQLHLGVLYLSHRSSPDEDFARLARYPYRLTENQALSEWIRMELACHGQFFSG